MFQNLHFILLIFLFTMQVNIGDVKSLFLSLRNKKNKTTILQWLSYAVMLKRKSYLKSYFVISIHYMIIYDIWACNSCLQTAAECRQVNKQKAAGRLLQWCHEEWRILQKNEEKNLQLNELFRTSCGLPLSFSSNFVASSSVSWKRVDWARQREF